MSIFSKQISEALVITLKMILMVLISIIVGGALLTLVFLIPSDRIKMNVKSSVSDYKAITIGAWNICYPFYTEVDKQTESIKIMEAVSSEEGNAFSRAMNSVYYNYSGCNQIESLIKYVEDEKGYNTVEYARYWHGYLVYLRPLLYLLPLATVKMMNMTLQFLLCIVMSILLCKKIGTIYSFAFSGLVLALNPVTIFMSMQNDIIFYIASIASILLLLFNNRFKKT